MSKNDDDDLPDIKCPQVADAAVKIQKVYRGFQTRKKIDPLLRGKAAEAEDLPDLEDQGVADAALRIQKVYRGFQTRKQVHHIHGTAGDHR